MTLMLVDLDRLKPINDEHGHEAGDVALEAVAKLLRRCLRETDRVVRWGGDEFVIVRTPSDIEDAAKLAEEIRTNIAELRFNVSDTVLRAYDCLDRICPLSLRFRATAVGDVGGSAQPRRHGVVSRQSAARRLARLVWPAARRPADRDFQVGLGRPALAMRDGYIDVRASRRTDDETASVKIPTRRMKSL